MLHVPALIQYLKGLSENNNRAWFVMNKPSYDILREEFTTLVAQVIEHCAAFDPQLRGLDTQQAAKQALFRIHRDVRFAKDKRPYKTTFSAAICADGKKSQGPMVYFHIDEAGTLFMAAGCYRPEKDLLTAIRHHIAEHPKLLGKLLRNRRFVELGGFSTEDQLVRPPKGYNADTPHVDMIRLKSFVVRTSIDVSQRAPRELAATIATNFEAMYPLVMWLRGAVQAAQTRPADKS